MITDYLEETL